MTIIRPVVKPDDREEVYTLAMRSKGAWGYTEAELKVFHDEVVEVFASADYGFVAEINGEMVAYYFLARRTDSTIELDHLFVDACRMRQGIGTQLMVHAQNTARSLGYKIMSLISDPHAVGFYQGFGARKIGDHRSSLTGNLIPIMEIDL